MIEKLLLAISVLCGPGLWFFALAYSYVIWQPDNNAATVLVSLVASLVFSSWALWGIVSGPWRLRRWWFCLASLLNMVAGFGIWTSDWPHSRLIGALFLGYSFWQFVVFRRPALPRWPKNDN